MNVVKVVGIGTAGIHIINQLLRNSPGLPSVGAIVLTECELSKSGGESNLLLEPQMKGLGSPSNMQWSKVQTETSKPDIERFIQCDTVILTAGMGSQSSFTLPLVAQIANEMGVRTVGVVSRPFSFEGRRRRKNAEEGITLSREFVHILNITNADEVLRGKARSETSIKEAFSVLDDWLSRTILFYHDFFQAQV
jgi:cell division protein FtsZ